MFDLAATIVGAAAGYLISRTVATIPGLGSMHCMLAAGTVGIISPAAAPAAIVTALAAHNQLGCAKEAITPAASGNVTIVSTFSEVEELVDPEHQYKSLKVGKLIGLFGGTLAGFALNLLISLKSYPITLLVAIVIAVLALKKRHGAIAIAYLLMSQAFFALAPWLGITQPVYALSAGMFLIPTLLKAFKFRPGTGIVKPNLLPGPDFALSALLAFVTPGVSPNLIQATSPKATLSSKVTCIAAEAAVEAYGIVALLAGHPTGKTALGLELGSQLTPGLAILFLLVSLLASFDSVRKTYMQVCCNPKTYPLVVAWSLLAGTATVIATCGPIVGPVLIVVGVLVDFTLTTLRAPSTIRSLLFLGPVLF